jgi:trehalose/maltose hydrolase-like predicted phosphorylase
VLHRLWEINELSFQSEQLNHYETLFTIGNGYLGTRGSFEEGCEGEIPATLLHGVYDHAPGMLVPELANAPNWLSIKITIDETPFRLVTRTTDFMRPPEGIVIGYNRTLHLDRGLLRREVLFRATSGSVVRLEFERFASLHDEHVLAQRLTVTAVDGSPQIKVESLLDTTTMNATGQHWLPDMQIFANGNETGIEAATQQSGYVLGMASRLISDYQPTASRTEPSVQVIFTLQQEQFTTLDKISAVYTSRDAQEPLEAARAKAEAAADSGYEALLADHDAEWAKYWDSSDIEIDGDEECQRAIRFTTYHILIAAPRRDEHVSIGAKTLSGFGYKGHIFWDTELFAVPPLTLSQPQLARNLLMYRYHNLQGARNKAKANGCEGAMFPWESTDTGEETTPQWSDVQPDGSRIRIWTGDSEQHISTDITYAVWQYWQWTGEDDFFTQYGAEMILDTAVFWGSRVEAKHGRYEISQQIGPDEYHENIDNSVFVNRMVVWHLQTALKTLEWLRRNAHADAERLIESLGLTAERLAKWQDIIEKMVIPFDAERQIHVQFPGFFDMEYIPVPKYEPRTTSVQAILGHARSIQSQVIKQADVVMMMALLGESVGTPNGANVRQVMLNNWNTYYPRTDHGSSLSPAMHAWVAARLGLNEEAYELFYHAAHIDLQDNKGNVKDGIHAAACGGVWQALVFGFCGLKIDERGEPALDPHLPEHWRQVRFTVYYRGEKRAFTVDNPVLVSSSNR